MWSGMRWGSKVDKSSLRMMLKLIYKGTVQAKTPDMNKSIAGLEGKQE